jgi:hypothetical protein
MAPVRRRTAIAGAAALATPFLIAPRSAHAFSESGQHLGIGCALLQGLGSPDVKVRVVVQQAADSAAQAVRAALPTEAIVSSLAQNIGSIGPIQVFPLFCNPGPAPVPIDFVSAMSRQPLDLSAANQRIARRDPARYLRQNLDIVGAFLRAYSTGPNTGFQRIIVPGSTFTAGGSTPSYLPSPVFLNIQPTVPGIYATGISFGKTFDRQSLLSLFVLHA